MNKKHFMIIGIILIGLIVTGSVVYATLAARAFGNHDVGRMGYYTTNIGQFMPYDGSYQRTIEYPINSGHICIYRQSIMLGVPVNVISAADGGYEEFDAVPGFHNPDSNAVAISNNPDTWPRQGGEPYWPVRDDNGDPYVLSQQDSYCVYSDSTNWRYLVEGDDGPNPDMLLDLRVHQSIYSWGVDGADKFVVLKFEIENASDRSYEEMYFNYYSDLDIGGIEDEWPDDCVGFDKDRELVYFYDADNMSDEWGEEPFLAGITFLKTPNDQGITDFHWIDVAVDEVDVENALMDSISYYLMRSDTTFFHNHPDLEVSDYFHLGDNPSNGTHFDDPATSRITNPNNGNLMGGPMVAYICNGPFDVQPGESAEIWVAVMVGDNEEDLLAVTDQIWEHFNNNFDIAVIPPPPLSVKEIGDDRLTLMWDNSLEVEWLPQDENNILHGYKIYRTIYDRLADEDWTEVATIPLQYVGETVVDPEAYTYTDDTVYNGFLYYYNIRGYYIDETGGLKESPQLRSREAIDELPSAVTAVPSNEATTISADLDLIKVVPNPYVISADWDLYRLGNAAFGEPIRKINFTHLPVPCTVRVFTIDGDLVQTLHHTGPRGDLEWNLLTSENRPIVSGMYFYHVESDLGEKLGRFAVIR